MPGTSLGIEGVVIQHERFSHSDVLHYVMEHGLVNDEIVAKKISL